MALRHRWPRPSSAPPPPLSLPALLLTLLLLMPSPADAAQRPFDEADLLESLLVRYAPLLFLHPEESWFPGDVDDFISHVKVLDTDGLREVVNYSLPVGSRSLDSHLVSRLPRGLGTGNVQPPKHLRGTSPASGGVPVYVSVNRCESPAVQGRGRSRTRLPSFVATYWMFYPFSEGKRAAGRLRGSHVGDWEHVSVKVQDGAPVSIYISAHEFGAYYNYEPSTSVYRFASQNNRGQFILSPKYAPTLQTFGNHPVLYVAKGSHGVWPNPGVQVYSRWPRLTDVTGAGQPWLTWRRLVPLHVRPPQWLRFLGRWGNPADCYHLLGSLCTISGGPTGIPLKPPAFQCPAAAGSGRSSRWSQLLG